MVHNPSARQVFRKYGHPYNFLKRGTTHNPAVFEKTGHLCVDFVMAITLSSASKS